MIEVDQLTRIFRTYKKRPGFWGGVRGLLHREFEETAASSSAFLDRMAPARRPR
jgi:ABC-2 type transport system ATP-binding protein